MMKRRGGIIPLRQKNAKVAEGIYVGEGRGIETESLKASAIKE